MTDAAAPPASPEAISPAWLMDALQGALGGATIEDVDREPIGDVEGFTGQVVRIRLHFHGGSAPRSLVAKFPSADPKRRALATRLGYSAREQRFYRDLAPRCPIRVPRRYYGEMDAASGSSVLLLEDLGGWACLGDRPEGCSPADAQLVVTELARLHAAFWHEGGRDDLAWVPSFALGADKTEETFRAAWWPAFVEKVDRALPCRLEAASSARQLGVRLGDRIAALKKQLAGPPRTLAHLDCRPDNLFIAGEGAEARLALIDWENIVLGRGPLDVAYFLSTLPPEQRRASEGDLLRRYHAALLAHGVRGYGLDACLHDVRLSFVQPFVAMVYGVTVMDILRTARGRRLVDDTLTRLDAAAADHGLLGLVS